MTSTKNTMIVAAFATALAGTAFAHSGATLLASEIQGRVCYTCDIDPVFCEIAIRRLENYRATGKLGWQNDHPFVAELDPEAQT